MNHTCNNCNNCNNCIILRKKVNLYEKLLSEIKTLEENMVDDDKITDLENSIIIENDVDGNRNMKIKSDLSESFMIIEDARNLKELSQREVHAIKEQDNLNNFMKVKCYIDKVNSVYGVVNYALKIGKWFII
jgi:hypothetical protein